MPAEVTGALELRKALKEYAPFLAKESQKELSGILRPITAKARGFMPSNDDVPSGWLKRENAGGRWANRYYDQAAARRGITFSAAPSKANRKGFRSLAAIYNKSAAGAIYETAGRKNPGGQPWNPSSSSKKYSHSKNPNAGRHFINSLGALEGRGMMKGRAIFKAWEQDQGKAYGGIIKAVDSTLRSYERTAKK